MTTAARKAPTLVLTFIVCATNKYVTAKFFGTLDQAQAAALRWAAPRRSYCALHYGEDVGEDEFLVPDEALELWELLFPTCEHGLSAQLCYGPDHYCSDAEIAAGW